MIAALWYLLTLVGPDWSAAAGPPPRLPGGGVGWDHVGTFGLTDPKGKLVAVRLYVEDSDAATEKGLTDLLFRPNHFDLHAMYRVGAGGWEHRLLLSTVRVCFARVKERAADGATIELRSTIELDSRELARKEYREWADKVRTPWARKLTLAEGAPVLK
jgi:hypothetical protein